MKIFRITASITALFITLILSSCGSSDLTKILSAEDRFDLGKTQFEEGDYLEAITEFEIVKLQYPGSAVADDAQYFLAECRFKQEEFLLAAQEYQELRRSFPASNLLPVAQYKIALCYYNLAPKSSLDQQYTLRAIDEFQAFVEYYPANELASDASVKIKEMNSRLAKKLYDTAELYMIMEYFKAATLYYNSVTEKYHDTQYSEPSHIGKIKSLIARKRFKEAKQELDKYLDKYPNSTLKSEADVLQNTIDDNLRSYSNIKN